MAGFLQDLGAFGAGIAPSINDLAANQSNADFGNALASIYGGGGTAPNTSTGSGGLGGLLASIGGALGGGAAGSAQQSPSAAAIGPQTVQGGMQPVPQGTGMGTTTPGQPGGVASSLGPSAPAQQSQQSQQAPPQQAPQPAPQAPGGMPAQAAQPQARPMAQQQAPIGKGPLDLPTLVRNLVKQGVTGARLGNAVTRFIPLLNAQGLQQYRDLGLQLRNQQLQSLEQQRQWNRNPNAPGSQAQSRTAHQGIAVQSMQAIQQRFKERMDAAMQKLASAKTDKEAAQAKGDMDKVASDLKSELQSELNIVNTPGTSREEQQAALAEAAKIRQQLQDATDAAVKARRSGPQAQSAAPGAKAAPGAQAAPGDQKTVYGPGGQEMRYKGTGDKKDPANWEPVSGGQ